MTVDESQLLYNQLVRELGDANEKLRKSYEDYLLIDKKRKEAWCELQRHKGDITDLQYLEKVRAISVEYALLHQKRFRSLSAAKGPNFLQRMFMWGWGP